MKAIPTTNSEFSWSEFDSESYFQHYYGEPHVDDERVIHFACQAFERAAPTDRLLNVVDVGTGPNLFPMMCALPRAASLTAWEYSSSNVKWIRSELIAPELRPQFKHFWQNVQESYSERHALPADPLAGLLEKTEVVNASIFDLPEGAWDAATMFFCAESITSDRSEFNAACHRFARCVRSGGALIAAFLIGSSGYEVAERAFPVLNVTEDDIRDAFKINATIHSTEKIGIVEREIRSGYSGMLFLSAQAL